MWAAAVVLVLGGTAMLGYAGWEYYGTDVLSRRQHAELRDELRARWAYPDVAAVLGPQAAVTSLGTADALVRIPRFGEDYEMPLIEGVRGEDLAAGIGHFPGTEPGQIGNVALAANRVTNGEPFGDLSSLRPGDEVIVETEGATYTYVMDTEPDDLVVSFADGWVLDPVPVPPAGQAPPGMPALSSAAASTALITLTSCSELFHSDERLVAFGHLVSTVAR